MDNENLNPAEEAEETSALPEQKENTPAPETAEETPENPTGEETGDEEDEEAEYIPPFYQRIPRRVLLFISIIMGFALCLLILICCAMSPLKRLLSQYESAQPKHVASEVYDMLFADPDWDLIYDLAGVESTAFEGKDAFIRYMEAKTAGQELTCLQTTAGLSGDCKYTLSLEDETLAAFTLTQTSGSTLSAQWTLAEVEVFFQREESITIVTSPDCTVYINGVALDDSYVISTTQTLAEDYLPEGTHGYRLEQLQVTDLLCTPEIVVLDRNFNRVSLYHSDEADVYSTDIPTSDPITDEEYTIVLDAAQTQALFAVRACNISELRQHFDANTQIYTDLSEAEPFCESYQSHVFDEESICVTDFCRYSDTLFSVRVSLTMDVTTKKNVTTTYELDTTYFFSQNNSGAYLVTDSIDADLTQQHTQVRLTFVMDDTVVLSEMVGTDTTEFSPPEAINAEGAYPLGWGRLEADGSLTMVLSVRSDGKFQLAEGQALEAMALYPIYGEVVVE